MQGARWSRMHWDLTRSNQEFFLKKNKKEQKITNKLHFTKLNKKSGWASSIPHQPCCFHLLTENSSRTLQTESFFSPVFLGMLQLQLGMPAPLCSRIRGNPRQPLPARVVKIIKLHFLCVVYCSSDPTVPWRLRLGARFCFANLLASVPFTLLREQF